jgi:hypothetical protein
MICSLQTERGLWDLEVLLDRTSRVEEQVPEGKKEEDDLQEGPASILDLFLKFLNQICFLDIMRVKMIGLMLLILITSALGSALSWTTKGCVGKGEARSSESCRVGPLKNILWSSSLPSAIDLSTWEIPLATHLSKYLIKYVSSYSSSAMSLVKHPENVFCVEIFSEKWSLWLIFLPILFLW